MTGKLKVGILGACALAATLAICACSATGERTVEGEIASVEGEAVTVQVSTGGTDTFLINDDTQITGAQGSSGQPGGVPSDGDAPPEMSSGDNGNQPPDMPSGAPGNNGGEPPEKPSGDKDGPGNASGEPPAKPDGDDSNKEGGTPPDMPGGGNSDKTLSVGMEIKAEVNSNNVATSIEILSMGDMGANGGPGGNQAPSEYAAAYTYDESTTVSGETLESTGTDENVVLVDKDIEVTLDDDTIVRTSSDSTGGDNASFYGVGAALLATDGKLNVNGNTISTDAKGGAGVFAYGDGVVEVSDTTITTKQDTSGGIHVAGGGTLTATNVSAETNGESSAAIRSDRGGGTMTVNGGDFVTNGIGSPAIYSTADIKVANAKLTANNSEAICIEGLNSIELTDCDLVGNIPDDERNEVNWNVILYQSMSGDSEVGNSTFSMEGGTLTAKNGGMFYTTNTESTFVIKNVDITYSKDNPFLLRCTGNSNKRGWGQAGSNGADCSFTAIQQKLEGDVQWDSISKLDMQLTEGSKLAGAFVQDESNAGDGGDGYANLTIDKGSKWVVTGDSVLSILSSSGTIEDESGKSVTIKDANGKILSKGYSSYAITVKEFK